MHIAYRRGYKNTPKKEVKKCKGNYLQMEVYSSGLMTDGVELYGIKMKQEHCKLKIENDIKN